MRKAIFIGTMLIFGKPLFAENICHKKAPGECELCCQKSNELAFKEAVGTACANLKDGIHSKAALNAEVTSYITQKTQKNEPVDGQLFRSYLEQNCSQDSGQLRMASIKMSYSDCAKNCPKPNKKLKNRSAR